MAAAPAAMTLLRVLENILSLLVAEAVIQRYAKTP
jgi:hypothetical protein